MAYRELSVDTELYKNCSVLFDTMDINNNGFVGLFEMLQGFAVEIGFDSNYKWQEKIKQINCSMCLTNPSLYYM